MPFVFAEQDGLPDPNTAPQFYEGVAVKRLVAWLIDSLGILGMTLVVWLFGTILTLGFGFFLFGFLYIAIAVIWRAGSIARTSATPGMLLMAIELRNNAGNRLEPGPAVLHTLLYLVLFAFGITVVATMVAMAVTPRRQGLHDLLLGTAAINRPVDA
jgi:uncharacterized RDD family membrane protein YckC